MSKHKQSKRKNNNILRQVSQVTKKTARRAVRGLVRDLTALKQRRLSQAGFVLPTVTMVMLVVILLTIAISLRSFDRADQARNVRVNQQLINAATPALDRAKAKLEELLVGGDKTSGIPDDSTIYKILTSEVDTDGDGTTDSDKYTFGDETRLRVRFDRGDDGIDADGSDGDETTLDDAQDEMAAAWMFPVDTDNDGSTDSKTIYSIVFKEPATGEARTPLEARTPPMQLGESSSSSNNPICEALDSSTSFGSSRGWVPRSGILKKSFFVYIANISDSNGGVSALEYQQDWSRVPPTTNAIRYEGDLEIAPGPEFRLNGRIQTLSNLIISPSGDPAKDIDLYLVSDPLSCFYNGENNQIIVGGNVVNGLIGEASDPNTTDSIDVHLMKGTGNAPDTTDLAESVDNESSKDVYYDTAAYEERIDQLATVAADNLTEADYPATVKELMDGDEPPYYDSFKTYFKGLVRNVPRAEGDWTLSCFGFSDCLEGTGDDLRPKDSLNDRLVFPDPYTENTTTDISIAYLDATDPDIRENNPNQHFNIGDRLLVGHNLPQQWWDDDKEDFVTEDELADEVWQDENGDDTTTPRLRQSQIKTIARVGAADRDGIWEKTAAKDVEDILSGEGGLRVITGAGKYSRDDSFLPPPYPESVGDFTVVWPDTMPMSPVVGSKVYDNVNDRWFEEGYDPDSTTPDYPDKGDLKMRASVVYHYARDAKSTDAADLVPQKPAYCVSSYYDPSTEETALNAPELPNVSGFVDPTYSVGSGGNTAVGSPGKSNNGVVYDFPATTYATELDEQSKLIFPDGRFVNELLYKALAVADVADRTLSEQAAVDAAICAEHISADPASFVETPDLPHGAIKEIAFLDPRQIKAVEDDDPDTDVDETFTWNTDTNANITSATTDNLTATVNDLSLEERQPLEIRATQLDLNALRNAEIPIPGDRTNPFQGPTPEYFLPNTGIIYATRDDALPDISDVLLNVATIDDPYKDDDIGDSDKDLLLDPTRRPNGIMLINGQKLARNDDNNNGHNDTDPTSLDDISKEKGLVMVSNDPVYIHGTFNPHDREEFLETLVQTSGSEWSNFYTRGDSSAPNNNLDPNFACRPGDPRLAGICTTGDSWRSAKVVADAITVMSNQWRAGFRNEGDFDLRNNAGNGANIGEDALEAKNTVQYARLFNGFFANDYAINGLSARWSFPADGSKNKELEDSDYSGATTKALNSSYFNNFQTPVQRRTDSFPEYLMEMCRKTSVSECTPQDWVVGYDVNGNGNYDELVALDVDEDGVKGDTDDMEGDIKAHQMAELLKLPSLLSAPDKYTIARLLSGSTRYLGSTAFQKENQRYPHRVAFKRNIYGQLILEQSDSTGTEIPMQPIPMGISSSSSTNGNSGGASDRKPDEYSYKSPNPLINTVKNGAANSASKHIRVGDRALWFRTTTNKNDPSDTSTMTYENDRSLFYLDPSKLGTSSPYSEFADTEVDPDSWLLPLTPTVDGEDLGTSGSDYAVCIGNQKVTNKMNKEYQIVEKAPGSCTATTAITSFNTFKTKLENLEVETTKPTWTGSTNLDLEAINYSSDTSANIEDDNTSGPDGVIVYEIPGSIGGSDVVTISLAGTPNTIFVLRATGAVTFGTASGDPGVRMLLKGGVNPNNIFWVFGGGVTFNKAASAAQSHQLTGNFIGSGDLKVGDNTNLLGVRLLGFSNLQDDGGGTIDLWDTADGATSTKPRVTTTSSQAQPLLVPVLQIHQPKVNATATTTAIGGSDDAANATKWIPRATETTFNLIFYGGDVPSDPENLLSNGGVQNLVRLIENWQKPSQQKTKIQGAFMQAGRSKFATAPLQQAAGDATESNLFGYPMKYYIGTGDRKHGIFSPPNREWGYDVGLLSQPTDFFDSQLSDPVVEPDEFFREVSRNDAWVKALLCAVEDDDNNTPVASNFNNPDSDFCNGYK